MRTVAFIVARRLLGLIGLGPSPDTKDVEIAVHRHQLKVLQREIGRPLYTHLWAEVDPDHGRWHFALQVSTLAGRGSGFVGRLWVLKAAID